jgi:hypothetical protein
MPVSVKETSICIVDDTGRIVREVKVASEPEALLQVLSETLMGARPAKMPVRTKPTIGNWVAKMVAARIVLAPANWVAAGRDRRDAKR